VNGRFAIPTAPGFGITLSKDAEKRMEISAVSLG
jgi:L-alanine-DL-glutamate epimerase-like enolase superfamily enzyme